MISLPVIDAGARRRELEREEERQTLLKYKIDSRGGAKGSLAPQTLKYFMPVLHYLRAPQTHPALIVNYPGNFVRAKPADWSKRGEVLEAEAKDRLKGIVKAVVAEDILEG